VESFYLPGILLAVYVGVPSATTATIVTVTIDCAGGPKQSAGKMEVVERFGTEVLADTGVQLDPSLTAFSLALGEERWATVQFTLPGDAQPSARRDVLISPGWVTSVLLFPRP
jgi:hypothetical protein